MKFVEGVHLGTCYSRLELVILRRLFAPTSTAETTAVKYKQYLYRFVGCVEFCQNVIIAVAFK